MLQCIERAARVEASFYIPENTRNFPTTDCFKRKISMKLFYQYMAIIFDFSPTPTHLHSLLLTTESVFKTSKICNCLVSIKQI